LIFLEIKVGKKTDCLPDMFLSSPALSCANSEEKIFTKIVIYKRDEFLNFSGKDSPHGRKGTEFDVMLGAVEYRR